MKTRTRRLMVLLLALVMALGCLSVTAGAATIPVKKLKNLNYDASCSAVKKKATGIKRGTFRIQTGTLGKGWLKFKAPKKKTYTFTFANVSTTNRYGYSTAYCHMDFIKKYKYLKRSYFDRRYLKTQGGKAYTLWFGTKDSISNQYPNLSTLRSRYGKLKLKKGQTVYLFLSFSYPGDSCTLNIK